MRVMQIKFGPSQVLERGVVIHSVTWDEHLQLTIVLGENSRNLTILHRNKIRKKTQELKVGGMRSLRSQVSVVDHERHPPSTEETTSSVHTEHPSPYTTLAKMVDSGNLKGTLEKLDELGRDPPRLCNVVVSAHLSSDPKSRQYVGIQTAEKWMTGPDLIEGERRLYSLLDLAWRRRYHFVSHALLLHEQYSKTGMLHYVWEERELWNGAFDNTVARIFPSTVTEIVRGYVHAGVFPHVLDEPAIVVEGIGEVFEDSISTLFPPTVLSDESVGVLYAVDLYPKSLGLI